MKRTKINSLVELRTEIVRLKQARKADEAYFQLQIDDLVGKFEQPLNFFNRIKALVPGSSHLKKALPTDELGVHKDWVTRLLSVGLPFLVNRMLFPKAGYIKRILLGLATTQAASFVNKDTFSNIVDKVTQLIKPKKRASGRIARAVNTKGTQRVAGNPAPTVTVPPPPPTPPATAIKKTTDQ